MQEEHLGGAELRRFSSDGVDIAFIDAEPTVIVFVDRISFQMPSDGL